MSKEIIIMQSFSKHEWCYVRKLYFIFFHNEMYLSLYN